MIQEPVKRCSSLDSVRALLQFTTILPLGELAPFEAFSRRTWIYPLAGYVTGGIAAVLVLCLGFLGISHMIMAVLVLGSVVFLSGANHLDGLLDLGDGLMAHGSREKRITALTDRQLGTGAVALGFFILLLSIAFLTELPPLTMACAILCAEVCGKGTMAFLTALGKPFHSGIHALLHEKARAIMLPCTVLLCFPLCALPVPIELLVVNIVMMVFISYSMRSLAYRLFGGVNGDIVGATHEIMRAVVLGIFAIGM
ncbi:MAG: adenosylcobinamide-GDP ribazoletransferase [Methanomicrobiales archaeon]|nr:adenosylcobinamide-GDP ribazoletransferase [Methanomicrobiales archaeon]